MRENCNGIFSYSLLFQIGYERVNKADFLAQDQEIFISKTEKKIDTIWKEKIWRATLTLHTDP